MGLFSSKKTPPAPPPTPPTKSRKATPPQAAKGRKATPPAPTPPTKGRKATPPPPRPATPTRGRDTTEHIVNIASGNDRIGIQVGRVYGRSNTRRPTPDTRGGSGGSGTPDTRSGSGGSGTPGTYQNTNIATGNAQVGCQADEIHGPLTITFTNRRK